MVGINETFRSRVITPRGIINKWALVPGDHVFEYQTNKLLEVQSVMRVGPVSIWRIEYSDGRTNLFPVTGKIFTGNGINSFINVVKENLQGFDHIRQFPVDFKNGIHRKLFPDPYIAGALIIYGNYDDPYINLPMDRNAVNEEFAFKYGITYAEKLGRDCCYYKWDINGSSDPITWKEFFPNHTFYAKDGRIGDPLIPKEYRYSSIQERMRMINGIFDVGYDADLNPDTVSITHKSEFRLREVQKLLWSLGIISGVTYDPTIRNGRKYILRIHKDKEGWPGFFYNIDSIKQMISNDHLIRKSPLFSLIPVKAEYVSTGYIHDIVLQKKEMLYLGANYIPMVSL